MKFVQETIRLAEDSNVRLICTKRDHWAAIVRSVRAPLPKRMHCKCTVACAKLQQVASTKLTANFPRRLPSFCKPPLFSINAQYKPVRYQLRLLWACMYLIHMAQVIDAFKLNDSDDSFFLSPAYLGIGILSFLPAQLSSAFHIFPLPPIFTIVSTSSLSSLDLHSEIRSLQSFLFYFLLFLSAEAHAAFSTSSAGGLF